VRVSALLASAIVMALSFATPAKAGLLELRHDNITRHWNCDITPCRSNHLAYKQVYARDRYLAYDIHTSPAKYEMRRSRVMIAPPTVVLTGGASHHRRWLNVGSRRGGLVALPVHGGYRVVRPAQYAWVTKPVLVSPARAYVTRRAPHFAYYPETIVVQGRGHRWGW
jgi:hypothetical protein